MDPVRDDLLAFLAAPAAFADGLPGWQREAWLAGLRFARQHVPADRPLRPKQVEAWEGSAGRRAALVLGPPGTGKTYLLAWMAAGFVHGCREAGRECRVLFTGFTRESIGKLFEDFAPLAGRYLPGLPVAFFGNPPGQLLPASVVPYPLGEEDLAGARKVLQSPELVAAATGWSLYKLFARGAVSGAAGATASVFDLVIADEASQLTLASGLLCLSGLAQGGRVLVAGDDRQLPPVRPTSDAVAADGRNLGGSLYDFLKSGGVPEFRLNETFRLNAPLADPPARLFYEGDYVSAVPHRRLGLVPGWAAGLSDWQLAVFDPEHPVCVLIHNGPPCGTENPFERAVLHDLVAAFADRLPPADGAPALTAAQLWSDRLAVVTPHRAQNAALREALKAHRLGGRAATRRTFNADRQG